MKAIRWPLKLMLVMITLPLILAVWLAKWFVVFLHRPQIREASLITDKFGLKKGSCQCHEPSCLIPICTKKSPSPCGNGEYKSYIIFSVYLTECTSQLNRWFSGGLLLTQTQPYIIPV